MADPVLWARSLLLLQCHIGYGGGQVSFSSVCVCVDSTDSGTGMDAVPVHSVLERCSSCQGKCGGSGDKLWVLCVSNTT